MNLNWHPKYSGNSTLAVLVKIAEFPMPRKEHRGTFNTWLVRKLLVPPVFESLGLPDKFGLFLNRYLFDTATARWWRFVD
jgi:hypothetical protein